MEFDYTLDFDEIDFRSRPELYRIGRGEQGVLSVEPYKSEILPHWRFRTPKIARKSAAEIYRLYLGYKADKDFVGMDMARKFLQMGWTRSLRYFNHKSGRKYVGPVPPERKGQSGAWGREVAPFERNPEKLECARIFKKQLDAVTADPEYLAGIERHQALYEQPEDRKKERLQRTRESRKPNRGVKSQGMKSSETQPRLGLVCITTTDAVRYRSVTRKRLLQFEEEEQQRMLRELYEDNLARLNLALDFCSERGIQLYRMTSSLFPFADDAVGQTVLEEFRVPIAGTGRRAMKLGIRLVLHPDQFVVLNSDSPQVISNSIRILETHARVMDMLKQPRSPWALIEIHGGKGGRAERLVETTLRLPEAVRSRIAFENDEYTYNAAEILEVCRASGVPMVFDAHHHLVHEKLDSYDDESVGEMLGAARETWPVPEWQLVHISNGRAAFGDRNHSDFIETMPSAFRQALWIEVEAKQKELAIARLQTEWLDVQPQAARAKRARL
jgi:UV DNA damage endonuclease